MELSGLPFRLENLILGLNNRIVTMEQSVTVKAKSVRSGAGGVAIGGDCSGSIVTGSDMIPKK